MGGGGGGSGGGGGGRAWDGGGEWTFLLSLSREGNGIRFCLHFEPFLTVPFQGRPIENRRSHSDNETEEIIIQYTQEWSLKQARYMQSFYCAVSRRYVEKKEEEGPIQSRILSGSN